MEFSVMVWPHSSQTVAPVVRLAQLAERLGYQTFYVGDSHMIWNDAWVTLGCCAAATDRIRLGPGVTNTVTRHPTVTANSVLTLNNASNGRAVLGIGAGDSAARTSGLNPHRRPQMRASIEMIAALLRGEEVDVESYQSPVASDALPKRAWAVESKIRVVGAREWGSLPIQIAVTSPKSVAIAAEIGDGVMIDGHMGGNAEGVAASRDAAEEGARRAQRDPADIHLIAALDASIDDNREKAFDKVRPTAARVIAKKQYLPATLGVEHADVVEAVGSAYRFYEHLDLTAKHQELVPNEVVQKCTIAGSPQDCIRKAPELNNAGVAEIALEITSQDEEAARRTLERFASEVVPLV